MVLYSFVFMAACRVLLRKHVISVSVQMQCVTNTHCGSSHADGQNAAEVDQTGDWVVPAVVYWIAGAFCLQW